eukprot:XP_003726928.1 PREDICTED: uncharacterized protein LOC100888579 [Strongylocentrotus purpuratus]
MTQKCMKLCAVVGCGNESFQLEKWKQGFCSKHQTRFGLGCCDCPPPFRLFPFPTDRKDAEARKRWNKFMNKKDAKSGKNWMNKFHDRVCSIHFLDGEPTVGNPDPVLHLGYKPSQRLTPKRALPREREEVHVPRNKKACSTHATPDPDPDPTTTTSSEESAEHDHRYIYKCDCRPDCDCQGCVTKQRKINQLEHKVKDLEHKLISRQAVSTKCSKSSRKKLISAENIKTDKDVVHCTGMSSKQAFEDMFSYLEPKAKNINYWKSTQAKKKGTPRQFKSTPKKSGPKRKLQIKDEFLMVLMRLRLDLTIQFLALLFGVVPSTCSQVVTTWVRFLAITLKPFIVWPSRPSILLNMPKQFRNRCRNLRCIIDCTEMFIERPRSLEL